MELKAIGWEEYLVFFVFLISSMGIGVYYGCFGSKQKSAKEFLLANQKMSPVPVSLSLICSTVSAVTFLSNPVEIYMYGTQYIVVILSYVPFNLALAYLYIPVYFNLNVKSAYEFIEIRFNSTARLVISVMAVIHVVCTMSFGVYATALAIEQVTGIDVNISSVVIYLSCIFYSALGGLKAVLWADVLQAMFMLASLLAVIIKGIIDLGGLSYIWERADLTGRIEFLNFDPDPRTRHTVWTCLIGGYFGTIPFFVATQTIVQRFLSMPTIAAVKKCLVLNLFGLIIIVGLSYFTGLVILAKFYDCDPIGTKEISKSDQLVPYFVESTALGVPGLMGLFIAGLTSASMSSLSSGLTALASITTYDYVTKLFPHFSDAKLGWISKINTLTLGLVSCAFVFVVQNMGSILPASSSIIGVFLGPVFGLFTLGMFFPWANTKGSLSGLVATYAVMIAFVLGINLNSSDLPNQSLPRSQEGCASNSSNSFVFSNHEPENNWKDAEYSTLIRILSISFMWHSTISFLISLILGLVFSFMFKVFSTDEPVQVNYKCISPPMLVLWKTLFPKNIEKWVDFECDPDLSREKRQLDVMYGSTEAVDQLSNNVGHLQKTVV